MTSRISFGLVFRYGVMGGLSALSHLGTTWALVSLGLEPTIATSIGFAVSVIVSYALQRGWVFRSRRRHRETIPRFLIVVALAGATNWLVVFIGSEVLQLYFLGPQIVALIIIPVQNFVLNSVFTFGSSSASDDPGQGRDLGGPI
ncbi:MAG: GtrA family protein [Actinobacteria bacterium]|nr:GtrA family protein [Actinomycetota bacterium]MBU1609334.1 GtrA family protein [Actinomycetota bacterium]MBU2314966.1 GtrA family protein [Actinomycetota bacterium]MBU2385068.1 GtrA family protein [Actinomycetota bacterium]